MRFTWTVIAGLVAGGMDAISGCHRAANSKPEARCLCRRGPAGEKSMNEELTFPELANQILNGDSQIFLAYDAQQAVPLMQHLGGAVAIVDLDLKGRDGLLLMQRLRERFPDLSVIAISSVLGVP